MMLPLLRFILRHPLSRQNVAAALFRLLNYQLQTRTREEAVFPWVGGTRLVARRHMWGLSGNIYAGLHEYMEMGFLLHFLRQQDLFLDVGANAGSWTVLASGVCGAKTIAVEPDPDTARWLERNIEENGIGSLVSVHRVALGAENGTTLFTVGLDTTNRIASDEDKNVRAVPLLRLDALLDGPPTLIKIDVEGHEDAVVAGASGFLSSPVLQALFAETVSPCLSATLEQAGMTQVWYDPGSRRLTREPNGIDAYNSLFVRDVEYCRRRVAGATARSVAGMRI